MGRKTIGARPAGVLSLVVILGLAIGISQAGGASSPCAGAPHTSADGTVVYGSPCADLIVVKSPRARKVFTGEGNDTVYLNPNVEEVQSGDGDDVVYGELPESEPEPVIPYEPEIPYDPKSPMGLRLKSGSDGRATASNEVICTVNPCYGGIGNQVMKGGGGNDQMFGQRGNDTIFGEDGNDALYGGIGDDAVFGNEHNDLVTGGYGAESKVDGGNGSDMVRGDGTADILVDQGGSGTDTVSFATAATPGFHGPVGVGGFPADADSEERGVSVFIDGSAACPGFQACNNSARYGGGNDTIAANHFENVIGSPFADLIVGSGDPNRIDGGGGTDVILGGGGNDALYGGRRLTTSKETKVKTPPSGKPVSIIVQSMSRYETSVRGAKRK